MLGVFGTPVWGIFDQGGFPAVSADLVSAVELRHGTRVSNAPQERGAFQSYNKVAVPYDAKITYAVGTSVQRRSQVISECERLIASLDFVSVVMPEFQYLSGNVTDYSLRRNSQRGVTLVLIDVMVQEIRVVASGKLMNTQSTNGAETQNNGNTQTRSATAADESRAQPYNQATDAQKNTVVIEEGSMDADQVRVQPPNSLGNMEVYYRDGF